MSFETHEMKMLGSLAKLLNEQAKLARTLKSTRDEISMLMKTVGPSLKQPAYSLKPGYLVQETSTTKTPIELSEIFSVVSGFGDVPVSEVLWTLKHQTLLKFTKPKTSYSFASEYDGESVGLHDAKMGERLGHLHETKSRVDSAKRALDKQINKIIDDSQMMLRDIIARNGRNTVWFNVPFDGVTKSFSVTKVQSREKRAKEPDREVWTGPIKGLFSAVEQFLTQPKRTEAAFLALVDESRPKQKSISETTPYTVRAMENTDATDTPSTESREASVANGGGGGESEDRRRSQQSKRVRI